MWLVYMRFAAKPGESVDLEAELAKLEAEQEAGRQVIIHSCMNCNRKISMIICSVVLRM